jgi:hypothetical protein
MSAPVAPFRAGEEVAQAFKPLAANVAIGGQWDGFPCLRIIKLQADYVSREAIRAEEAFMCGDPKRFAKARADLLASFAKLEAEVADMRARINGDDPTPPAAAARAAA